MKIRAKIKATGETMTLTSYGFGYVDCKGNFYAKSAIKVLEVLC